MVSQTSDLSHISGKIDFTVLRRGTFVVMVKIRFGTGKRGLASSQSLIGCAWVSMGLLAIMKKFPLISILNC